VALLFFCKNNKGISSTLSIPCERSPSHSLLWPDSFVKECQSCQRMSKFQKMSKMSKWTQHSTTQFKYIHSEKWINDCNSSRQ